MNDEAQSLLHHVLDVARRHGATAADAMFISGRSTTVRVRLGETEKVQQSRSKGLGLRVFIGSRSATTSTSDLARPAVEDLVARTVAAARVTAEDPFAGLPDAHLVAEVPASDLDLYDPQVAELTAEAALDHARVAEAAALGADPRLVNSEGSEMSWGYSELLLASSTGMSRARQSSSVSLWVTPVAVDGADKQRDYWWGSARHLADLDGPEAIGRQAARRALRRLGARKPETCQVPVIFEAPIASRLLGTLGGAVNGGALYKDASYLCGKLGERIAPKGVTVVDDPHLRRGPSSRTFDAEGLATRRNIIVDDGVLASYLLDTYTARKLGLTTTRSARRGLTSTPSPGSSNFWMAPGDRSLEELIADTPRGLLVIETSGFGVSTVNGDYSQGATGIWIEGGALAYPVHELTIASSLPAMWESVDGIADDLDPRRGISAPSLRIARMTVAGT